MFTRRDCREDHPVTSKTKVGLLLVVIVAVVAVPDLRDKALGLFGGPTAGTELVGEGETGSWSPGRQPRRSTSASRSRNWPMSGATIYDS
jgi:hypothetical protein